MSVKLVILLGGLGLCLTSTVPHQDQVAAPTSNWASVYSSDNTDYREPVRDQVYPLVKDVSRSDWFNSYPYHKFEEKREEKAEEPTGILESVAKAVGSVRQKITDFGDDVVNSALGLVGAEKTDDGYEERDGKPDPLIDFSLDLSFGLPNIGYVYNGFHLRGPQTQIKYPRERDVELSVDGNTVRPAFVQPDSVSPVSRNTRRSEFCNNFIFVTASQLYHDNSNFLLFVSSSSTERHPTIGYKISH